MIISCLIFGAMSTNKIAHASFEFTINFLKEVKTYAFKFVLLLSSKNQSVFSFSR